MAQRKRTNNDLHNTTQKTKGSNTTNPTKNPGWTRVLPKGWHLLLHKLYCSMQLYEDSYINREEYFLV